MECPKCRVEGPLTEGPYRTAAEEQRRGPALQSVAHPSGVEMAQCRSCGGVWLDAGELTQIRNAARSQGGVDPADAVQAAALRALSGGRTQRSETPSCPGCGEEMVEEDLGYGSFVRVDVCPGCGGAWLDPGELEAVEAHFAAAWR